MCLCSRILVISTIKVNLFTCFVNRVWPRIIFCSAIAFNSWDECTMGEKVAGDLTDNVFSFNNAMGRGCFSAYEIDDGFEIQIMDCMLNQAIEVECEPLE